MPAARSSASAASSERAAYFDVELADRVERRLAGRVQYPGKAVAQIRIERGSAGRHDAERLRVEIDGHGIDRVHAGP